MSARHHVVSLVAAALVLAACSSGPDAASPDPTAQPTTASPSAARPAAASYVALGDSYTAGPGIDDLQTGAGLCQRSTHNWPSVVAQEAGLALTDVSCVGATTADLASTIGSGVLASGPRYVTVGVGGNDGGLFSSLITACAGGGASCSSFVDDQVPGILARTTDDIAALLDAVEAEAPDATVLLVGYPRIVPETGGCEAIGLPDSGPVFRAESALDASLADAAERAGVDFVSVREASEGHDACAGDEAWTNGRMAAAGDGITFHPTARGMEAVAREVIQAAGPADVP